MSKYEVDGHTRTLTWDDLKPGNVVRMVRVVEVPIDGGGLATDLREVASSYPDQTIVQVTSGDPHGTTWVRLARPYLYSTHDGTTAPGFLMGVEDYKVEGSRMVGPDSLFRLVLLSTGEAARMAQE